MSEATLTDCRGCGACCRTQEIPPGYLAVVLAPERWPGDKGDHQRVANLPAEAQSSLLDAIMASVIDSRLEDRHGEDIHSAEPCCWLDEVTGQCRWWKYRPSICRAFEVGSPPCLQRRREFGVGIKRIEDGCIRSPGTISWNHCLGSR